MPSVSPGPALRTAQYVRHRPEQTLLYQLVERHYPTFVRLMSEQGSPLPGYVAREFEDYLKCGRLEHGFPRVRCESCHAEKLVAFSCKRRGFCPSCGARRVVDSAALLVDEVLPTAPFRHWVLSVPFQLRFLFASNPALMGKALGIVYRTIATWLIHQTGFTHNTARTGAVTFIQRFGSALNLNVHFHMLFLDGVYLTRDCRGQDHPGISAGQCADQGRPGSPAPAYQHQTGPLPGRAVAARHRIRVDRAYLSGGAGRQHRRVHFPAVPVVGIPGVGGPI